MAPVAVHRHERPLALGHRGPIVGERIHQGRGNRGDPAGGHVLLVPDGRRSLSGIARGAATSGRGQETESRYSAKIHTMPPWLVWRAISGMKSAGARTSAGSSERTSPDRRNQSPPIPAYTATYCLPSGPRYVIGHPTTPDPTLNFHRGFPVRASAALNHPSSV